MAKNGENTPLIYRRQKTNLNIYARISTKSHN